VDPEVLKLMERQTALLEKLSGDETGEKAAGSTQTAAGLFGTGGIFSTPGIEPDVIVAHVRPHGLLSKLPRFGSNLEHPFFATITGVTDVSGSEPTNPCDDAPAGYLKGCLLTAQFGRIARDTQTIEFDKLMLQVNSGVRTELQLRGRLLGLDDISPTGLSETDVLNIVTMAEMVQVGVQIERKLSQLAWQGTPANNTAGGGYKEPPGLDNQIATGQVDAATGVACEALDSDVKDLR